MRVMQYFLPLAAVALIPAAGHAEEAKPAAPAEAKANSRAYIAFPDQGGVRDWRADDSDTVYLQDRQKNWFKAELIVPAPDLPFVQYIGIDAGGSGRLDRFGGIYVDGRRYAFSSFEPVDGPPKKGAKKDAAGDGE